MLAPRNITAYARNMGTHIPRTTQKIVVSMKKTEWKNPNSALSRKAEGNPIPQSSLLRR